MYKEETVRKVFLLLHNLAQLSVPHLPVKKKKSSRERPQIDSIDFCFPNNLENKKIKKLIMQDDLFLLHLKCGLKLTALIRHVNSFPIMWWPWKPLQLDGHLDWLHFDTFWTSERTCLCNKHRACKCYVTAQQPAYQPAKLRPIQKHAGRLSIDRKTAPHLSDPRDLLKCDALSREGVVKTIPISPGRNKELRPVRDFSPSMLLYGRNLCLEPMFPIATCC